MLGDMLGIPCRSPIDDVIHPLRGGLFDCRAGSTDYRFNPETLRYMEIYPVGYIDGQDQENDTPYIGVGKCSKID